MIENQPNTLPGAGLPSECSTVIATASGFQIKASMTNKSVINPMMTGQIVEMGEDKMKFEQVKCGEDFKGAWSNKTLPRIGDNVKVCFNNLGTGKITGFFEEGGYVGCIVAPHPGQRPQWHIDQFKRSGREFNGYMVFGREIKFLDAAE